jgi:hypothetical protein
VEPQDQVGGGAHRVGTWPRLPLKVLTSTPQERPMSMIRSILKTAVAAKVVQVASRELSKPENQRKLKEGLSKIAKQTRRR